MKLKELEQATIAQLSPALTAIGFRVVGFPGSTEQFYQPVGKNTAFCGFRLLRLQAPAGVDPRRVTIQPRNFQFQAIYQTTDLRTKDACLDAIEAAQDTLTGWRPDASIPQSFYCLEAGLVEVVQGLWLYSQMFEIPIPYLKKLP